MISSNLPNPLPGDRLSVGEVLGSVPDLRRWFAEVGRILGGLQRLETDHAGALRINWVNDSPLLALDPDSLSSTLTPPLAGAGWLEDTPSTWTGNQNDWPIPGSPGLLQPVIERISASPAVNLTGIAAPTNVALPGQEPQTFPLILWNVGAQVITLTHEDAASAAANQIHLQGGSPFPLAADGWAWMLYDFSSSSWRVLASGSGSPPTNPWPEYTEATWAANVDNYLPSTGLYGEDPGLIVRVRPTANVDLTGIANWPTAAPFGNYALILWNVGSYNVTLKHQSASSLAGNRFQLVGAADVVLAPDQWAFLFLDFAQSPYVWRLLQQSSGSMPPPIPGAAWLEDTPTAWAGNQDNWIINASPQLLQPVVERVSNSTGANVNLTGIQAPTNVAPGPGTQSFPLLLWNVSASGTDSITLTHEDAASVAANRFYLIGGNNFVLTQDVWAWLFYDFTISRWRVLLTTASSGQKFAGVNPTVAALAVSPFVIDGYGNAYSANGGNSSGLIFEPTPGVDLAVAWACGYTDTSGGASTPSAGTLNVGDQTISGRKMIENGLIVGLPSTGYSNLSSQLTGLGIGASYLTALNGWVWIGAGSGSSSMVETTTLTGTTLTVVDGSTSTTLTKTVGTLSTGIHGFDLVITQPSSGPGTLEFRVGDNKGLTYTEVTTSTTITFDVGSFGGGLTYSDGGVLGYSWTITTPLIYTTGTYTGDGRYVNEDGTSAPTQFWPWLEFSCYGASPPFTGGQGTHAPWTTDIGTLLWFGLGPTNGTVNPIRGGIGTNQPAYEWEVLGSIACGQGYLGVAGTLTYYAWNGSSYDAGLSGNDFAGSTFTLGINTTLGTYTPATITDWNSHGGTPAGSAPSSLADALDRIAAALNGLTWGP